MNIEQFQKFIESSPEYNEYINPLIRILNPYSESYLKYRINRDKSQVEEYMNYYKHKESSKYQEI